MSRNLKFATRSLRAAASMVLTPIGVIGCAGLLWLCTCVFFAAMLLAAREDAYDGEVRHARQLGTALERDILRSIELYELSLSAAAQGATNPRVLSLPVDLRNPVLFDRAATAKYLGPISVLDTNGKLLVNSSSAPANRVDWSELPLFRIHKEKIDSGLYISLPYPSEFPPHEKVIALSRRINGPNGSLTGVVVGRLSIDYFNHWFDGLSVGRDETIFVTTTNGTLITRLPYNRDVVGKNLQGSAVLSGLLRRSSDAVSGISRIDGVHRLYVYRRLPGLPFVIAVGPAWEVVFAGWRTRAECLTGFMALFSVVIWAGALLLARELRRRQRAECDLQRLARRDALTGLENRGAFDEMLSQEWANTLRTGRHLSLLFIDIDRFKSYNDHYGHQSGDRALKAVAHCISACVSRPSDHVARYGGEEFVVILPETDVEGAAAVAEEIRQAIHDMHVAHVKSGFGYVTASIGVSSSAHPAVHDGDALIRVADLAVYEAKSRGRNRVCIAAEAIASVPEAALN
ncbi:diguanylate cyclase [Burkholderia vietnamiensis]|nr:diguanylate cyclase [Burkholderia vietnamiensis]